MRVMLANTMVTYNSAMITKYKYFNEPVCIYARMKCVIPVEFLILKLVHNAHEMITMGRYVTV